MTYHSTVAAGIAPWQVGLGRALAAARERAKKSQTDVARFIRDRLRSGRVRGEVARVGTQTVTRIERGEGVNTNQIAAYLQAIQADLRVVLDGDLTLEVAAQAESLERAGSTADSLLTIEGRDLLRDLADWKHFLGLISVWEELGSLDARRRFLDVAREYAKRVAAGQEPTGTLGKP